MSLKAFQNVSTLKPHLLTSTAPVLHTRPAPNFSSSICPRRCHDNMVLCLFITHAMNSTSPLKTASTEQGRSLRTSPSLLHSHWRSTRSNTFIKWCPQDLQPKSGLRSRLRPALGECASPRSLQGSGDAGRLQTEFALEPDLDDLGTSTMTPVGSIIFELSPRVRLVHIPERREEESQVGQKGSSNHLRIPNWAISKPPHLESFPCIKLFTLMLQFEPITSLEIWTTLSMHRLHTTHIHCSGLRKQWESFVKLYFKYWRETNKERMNK